MHKGWWQKLRLGILLLLFVTSVFGAKVEIIPLAPSPLSESTEASDAPAKAPPSELEAFALPLSGKADAVRHFSAEAFQLSKPFLVLLPLSGPYQQAGEAVLAKLKQLPAFKPVDIIDTSLFSVEELVELIGSYQPQWLLGPLHPDVASALLPKLPSIPVLSFASPCPSEHLHCYALAPSFKARALHHLESARYPHALVVVDMPFWQGLSAAEKAHIMRFYAAEHVVKVSAQNNQAVLAEAFNMRAAQQRAQTLTRLLQHPLKSQLRLRQDIQHVVVLGSLNSAYQIRTLLKFWLVSAEVHWLPTALFSAVRFKQLLPTWPATQAYLFPFLVQEYANSENIGIFHAMGATARLILMQPKKAILTPLGVLQYHAESETYTLHVPWVEIKNGRIDMR